MKSKLTIGEFAKLRNVTTETLRHYDRIGLLKPIEVDHETGYRYYSILQYEVLGTIKELRQLGMSTDEIKKYLKNRNLQQSVDILKDEHDKLRKRIEKLQLLEESISEKIDYLESRLIVTDLDAVIIRNIEEREILTFDRTIKNEIELSYACIELENELKGIAPTLASNRYGVLLKQQSVYVDMYKQSANIFIFIKESDNINEENIKKIPAGIFACKYFKRESWNMENNLKEMVSYIEKEGYKICGDILRVEQIDIGVTDKEDEGLYEVQIPIEKDN